VILFNGLFGGGKRGHRTPREGEEGVREDLKD